VDVEEDDVGPRAREGRLGIFEGACLLDDKAVELEVHAHEHAERCVILDDERSGRLRLHFGAAMLPAITNVLTSRCGAERDVA
jgi:hypothetical protein